MALVAQQPLLFDTSIRNNLTYGCRREVPDEEIEAAARLASAHDFVQGFPAGYDTYVGDQGAHMSGGQKQRLSIARAVILKPQILVLDEATSALDAEAEGAVQDALDTVMVGRTTLVIAHRLSTIRHAHRIICMRDGKVVESGPPKELLAKQGYYWNLVRRQVCTLDDLSEINLELDQHPAEDAKVAAESTETTVDGQAIEVLLILYANTASAVGVLNEPSIHTCVQIPGGSAVILASDGLWEKVTTQEVAAITSAALKLKSDDQGATVAAKALVSEARSRWIQEGGDVDDITAVVVHLGEEQHMDFSVG
eukprot:symbB.v1.2.021057.t1/scaffold1799.1/size100815/2